MRKNELDKKATVAKIAQVAKDGKVDNKSNVHFLHIANFDKPVAFYSMGELSENLTCSILEQVV